MAFDPAPGSFLTGWTEDGTDFTCPIASVDQLTAAEADAVTGDWRSVMYRLFEHTFSYVEGLADADAPAKFSVRRSKRDTGTGPMVATYTFSVTYDEDSTSVTAE